MAFAGPDSERMLSHVYKDMTDRLDCIGRREIGKVDKQNPKRPEGAYGEAVVRSEPDKRRAARPNGRVALFRGLSRR